MTLIQIAGRRRWPSITGSAPSFVEVAAEAEVYEYSVLATIT
ncbi:MAG: hypothetical protein ACLPSW_12375 [Roseiarcus sp.]